MIKTIAAALAITGWVHLQVFTRYATLVPQRMETALATFRKGQTVTVHTASYLSRTPHAPKEGIVEKTTKAGEVHVAGWEFPFSASSGRQIIPAGHDKPLTSTAWIEI